MEDSYQAVGNLDLARRHKDDTVAGAGDLALPYGAVLLLLLLVVAASWDTMPHTHIVAYAVVVAWAWGNQVVTSLDTS